MSNERSNLLAANDLRQLGDLMFIARRLVEGLYAGRHRSPKRGHSTEFYDYRPYVAGDDPGRVDWKVYGRTERLYVRRYRHDAELNIYLLVDRSASMNFSGIDQADSRSSSKKSRSRESSSSWASKLEYARMLAAAIAYLAVKQNDRVGLLTFNQTCQPAVKTGGGWGHLQTVIDALETIKPEGLTDPVVALTQAHSAIRSRDNQRGLLVVLSDFLEPAGDWARAFGPMAHDRFDMVGLQILTNQELDLRGLGQRKLFDLETLGSVRTVGNDMSQAYQQKMREHIERLRAAFGSEGIDHQLLTTSMPPVEALSAYVARRGMRG